MTMRPATEADRAVVLDMSQQFLATTIYGDLLAHNPARLDQMAQTLMQTPNGMLLLAEDRGAVVGMIGCVLYDHPLSGERYASELVWWMDPTHRGGGVRLLRAAERWALEAGATKFQMIAPTPRVGAFYQAMGYTHVEDTYQKDIT